MQVFNGVVRLQGNLLNEVRKRGLTVPEIYILRRIHGNEAVVRLENVGQCVVDFLDERERLALEYDGGLAALSDEEKTSVRKMFGEDYTPLPEELRGFEGEISEVVGELDEFRASEPYSDAAVEEIGRQRRAANKTKAKMVAKTSKAPKPNLEAVL